MDCEASRRRVGLGRCELFVLIFGIQISNSTILGQNKMELQHVSVEVVVVDEGERGIASPRKEKRQTTAFSEETKE